MLMNGENNQITEENNIPVTPTVASADVMKAQKKKLGLGLLVIAGLVGGYIVFAGLSPEEGDLADTTVPEAAVKDTSIITDKSLIEEFRETGNGVNQRLEQAKEEFGMRESLGGPAEWLRGALDDVALSTAPLKILGTPVTKAEITLYEAPELSADAPVEEAKPGALDGLKSKAKGALSGLVRDAVTGAITGGSQ